MRIAVGADHAGFLLKQALIERLRSSGRHVLDLGTHAADPADYPDYAEAVARAVLAGDADRGVLICGSGVGASVAANKLPGIRAGLCHDTYSAHQGVELPCQLILVLGSRVIGDELAWELVDAFLSARFSGEPRHRARLRKVAALESRRDPTPAPRGG